MADKGHPVHVIRDIGSACADPDYVPRRPRGRRTAEEKLAAALLKHGRDYGGTFAEDHAFPHMLVQPK